MYRVYMMTATGSLEQGNEQPLESTCVLPVQVVDFSSSELSPVVQVQVKALRMKNLQLGKHHHNVCKLPATDNHGEL